MNKKSLASNIYISIIILMIIILISAAYTIFMINRTQEHAHETALNWLPSVDTSKNIKYELSQLRRIELKFSITNAPKEIEKNTKLYKERLEILNALLKKYGSLITEPEEKNLYNNFNSNWNNYLNQREKFVLLINSKKVQEANSFLASNLDPPLLDSLTIFEKIGEINYQGAINSTKKGENITFGSKS